MSLKLSTFQTAVTNIYVKITVTQIALFNLKILQKQYNNQLITNSTFIKIIYCILKAQLINMLLSMHIVSSRLRFTREERFQEIVWQ